MRAWWLLPALLVAGCTAEAPAPDPGPEVPPAPAGPPAEAPAPAAHQAPDDTKRTQSIRWGNASAPLRPGAELWIDGRACLVGLLLVDAKAGTLYAWGGSGCATTWTHDVRLAEDGPAVGQVVYTVNTHEGGRPPGTLVLLDKGADRQAHPRAGAWDGPHGFLADDEIQVGRTVAVAPHGSTGSNGTITRGGAQWSAAFPCTFCGVGAGAAFVPETGMVVGMTDHGLSWSLDDPSAWAKNADGISLGSILSYFQEQGRDLSLAHADGVTFSGP